VSWFKGRLRGALAQVDQPCPFCDNAVVYVKWDAERRRHRVKMVHPTATCPALVPGAFQDRATSYLADLLQLYGVRVAEYCEDELVGWHDWR
jgi:hypothetical protein